LFDVEIQMVSSRRGSSRPLIRVGVAAQFENYTIRVRHQQQERIESTVDRKQTRCFGGARRRQLVAADVAPRCVPTANVRAEANTRLRAERARLATTAGTPKHTNDISTPSNRKLENSTGADNRLQVSRGRRPLRRTSKADKDKFVQAELRPVGRWLPFNSWVVK
jgi:hypothetical protein